MAEASAKTKKKKKGEAEPPAPIPGRGTPEGDALRDALKAFDAGDYVQVRAVTATLATAGDADVRAAAAALRARTDVDPVHVVILAACAAVLGTIVYVWVF
ncbi:MAG: hypothetical protein KF729_06510 [Sandaracinaceae bacterium]|nr:hypothetical protein [Sandaracinaceae bacterium]